MKLTANPFSLFDFLGYFLTGFFFLYVSQDVILSYREVLPYFICKLNDSIKSEQEPLLFTSLFYIIVSYITGHIITFLSSITIEKYSIWAYKYPSKFLLFYTNQKGFANYFRIGDNKPKVKYIVRSFLFLFILPLVIMELLFSELLQLKNYYTKPFDKTLKDLVFKKLNIIYERVIFNEDDHKNEKHQFKENEDFFQPLYHYLIEKSERHFNKTQNYVALYGLLRNMTLISILFIWIDICNFSKSDSQNWCNFLTQILIVSSGMYLFFMGYMKFYKRFTKEVLLGVFSLPVEKQIDK